jgi:hypothetical protein
MRFLRILALVGLLAVPTAFAHAGGVSVGIGVGVGPAVVGPAPVCAYGYYPYYPYACAPVGYYGPQWFVGGVFIGAGPWFHGFHGPVIHGGPAFVGRPVFRPGFAGRGPAVVARGPVPGGFRGGPAFHGAWRR